MHEPTVHSGRRRTNLLMRGALTLTMLLSLGGHAAVQAPEAAASVAKSCSNVSGIVGPAADHWASRKWPSTPRGTWYTGTHTDPDNVIYGGGIFSDRDGQLKAHEKNSAGSSFNEYDVKDYPSVPQNRGTVRIVRNSTSGTIYLTTDHYANFCVFR